MLAVRVTCCQQCDVVGPWLGVAVPVAVLDCVVLGAGWRREGAILRLRGGLPPSASGTRTMHKHWGS